jgi:hypothetical protein
LPASGGDVDAQREIRAFCRLERRGHSLELALRADRIAVPQHDFREQQARLRQVRLRLQRVAQLDQRGVVLALVDEILRAFDVFLGAAEISASGNQDDREREAGNDAKSRLHG